MHNPATMVSIYFPTAANISDPELATVLVMSPNTPNGARRIIISVSFIMAWNSALKNELSLSLCTTGILVIDTPRNIAKKIIPSISPPAAA